MSTVKHVEADAGQHDEDAISNYLNAHPDFFERHNELLTQLKLPHSIGGGAVSLVERQVSVLRQRNDQLEHQLRDLVEVARGNDELATKIHGLAVLLMSAGDRNQVIDILEEQLRMEFSADRSVLVLFGAEDARSGQFQRYVERDGQALGPFRSFLEGDTARCGTVRDAQRDFLFGAENCEIGSVALIPLGPGSKQGFLAIGSRSADHFHPGKSIDFLSRLGDLVAGALAR